MGVSWNDFWRMNPRIIKAISKGYEQKIKQQDYLAWLFNQYTLSAVSVAVEHCLSGRKAKSKYIDKPIMQEIEQEKTENKGNMETLAVFEMKKRTHILEMQGLPESPI